MGVPICILLRDDEREIFPSVLIVLLIVILVKHSGWYLLFAENPGRSRRGCVFLPFLTKIFDVCIPVSVKIL